MSYAEKLAAAIEWLKSRNRHCLTTHHSFRLYKPVYGVPLEPLKK
jgi:hypothetical protein